MRLNENILKKGPILAPLAGITDPVFRKICRSHGAGLMFTEMVSAKGLIQGHLKTHRYLEFEAAERPVAIQLFGSDPTTLAEAARIAARLKPEIIDLNCGCPVRKVVKHNSGAALLKEVSLIGRIVTALVQAVDIPVTVKIRSGWDPEHINAVAVARCVQDAGAAAVIVHPRTQNMFFSGPADWPIIGQVKQAVSIPVIGNGDIASGPDAARMLKETGCDQVMVGRACLGNPWIFEGIISHLENGTRPAPVTGARRLETAREHLLALVQIYGEKAGVNRSKKHLAWYTRGLPFACGFRDQVFKMHRLSDVEKALKAYRTLLVRQESLQPEMVA